MERICCLILQIVKFGIVGVIAAVIDVGTLVLLREGFGVNELAAAPAAFTVSVVVNYTLSMRFVFSSKGRNKMREFTVFVLLSVGGLGINQLVMWCGVTKLGAHYLAVKLFAMIIVPMYNFATRKIFLEKRDGKAAEG